MATLRRIGWFLVVSAVMIGAFALVAAAMAGDRAHEKSGSSERVSGSTSRAFDVGSVTWTVRRSDVEQGGCIEVIAEVEGTEQGSLRSCGRSEDPALSWGIGGMQVEEAWFNVAYGDAAPEVSSVKASLGSGDSVLDEGIRDSDGLWLIVIPAEDPLDPAVDFTHVAALDPSGAMITEAELPSLVHYREQARRVVSGRATEDP